MNMKKVICAGVCALAMQSVWGSQEGTRASDPSPLTESVQLDEVSKQKPVVQGGSAKKPPLSLLHKGEVDKFKSQLADLETKLDEDVPVVKKNVEDISKRLSILEAFSKKEHNQFNAIKKGVTGNHTDLVTLKNNLEYQTQLFAEQNRDLKEMLQRHIDLQNVFEKEYSKSFAQFSENISNLQEQVFNLSYSLECLKLHMEGHCNRLECLEAKVAKQDSEIEKCKRDVKTLEEPVHRIVLGLCEVAGTMSDNFGASDHDED